MFAHDCFQKFRSAYNTPFFKRIEVKMKLKKIVQQEARWKALCANTHTQSALAFVFPCDTFSHSGVTENCLCQF